MDSSLAPDNHEHITLGPGPPAVIVYGDEPTAQLAVEGSRSRSTFPGPSGWNQSVSTLDIPQKPETYRKHFREVDDGGDSPSSPGSRDPSQDFKHQHELTPSSARDVSPWRLDDDISIGTAFDRGYAAAEKKYAKPPSTTKDTETELLIGIGAHSNSTFSLDDLIRSSLQRYGNRDESRTKKWLPFDKLFELVNESFVYQELLRVLEDKYPADKLITYTKSICAPQVYGDNRDNLMRTSCRSIFAILTLMSKVRSIPYFVDAGLSDKDLPLHDRIDEITGERRLYSIQYSEKSLLVPKDWLEPNIDNLMFYQGYMLSPFFELGPRHHELHSTAVLPFIEDGEKIRRQQGHHGSVWRVKIHPAHHDLHQYTSRSNLYFAVKELHSRDEEGVDFKNEVKAWAKSVGVAGHHHLIRLLATWRQDQRWHLLFPWANANVRDFWDRLESPHPDPSRVLWMAKQFLGIAEGLRQIHRSGSEDPEANHPDFGIHGDIKPENVLLFDEMDDEHGRLVICDFGFTRFHRKDTRSDVCPVGYSPTYRAPEFDMTGRISRAYDMWTLGCFYLEFITWYLTGSEGVEKTFCSYRTEDDRGEPIRSDKFFVCVSINQVDTLGVIIKPSVLKWIRHLRSLGSCSECLQDLLDVIEKCLLIVDPGTRARCGRLIRSLKRIHDKCISEGNTYYSTGSPKLPSEILNPVQNVPVPFSYPAAQVERMLKSDFPLSVTYPNEHFENTFMLRSDSSGERKKYQAFTNSNAVDLTQIAGQAPPLTPRDTEADSVHEVLNEETPLLLNAPEPRTSQENIRYTQSSGSLTQSPEQLQRSNFEPHLRPPVFHSTGHTPILGMNTQAEEDRTTLPRSAPRSLENQDMSGLSSTLHPSERSSLSFGGEISWWCRARDFLYIVGNWLSQWVRFGKTRTKPHHQDGLS